MKRYEHLEHYPTLIGKTHNDNFVAYKEGNNREGVVYLVLDECVEVYLYDEGSYMYQGTVEYLDEAIELAKTFT